MQIILGNFSDPQVIALLREHMDSMQAQSPPESTHALDLTGLQRAEVTFWCAWEGNELLGCGALKELNDQHGEVKSMRTVTAHLRKGVAAFILEHIVIEAKRRGYQKISLETGSMGSFKAAHALYRRFGFVEQAPFGDYQLDPHSLYFGLEL